MRLIAWTLWFWAAGCTGEEPPAEPVCNCGGLEGEFCDIDVRDEYICDEACDQICFCQRIEDVHEWVKWERPCVCLTDTGMENVKECDPPHD